MEGVDSEPQPAIGLAMGFAWSVLSDRCRSGAMNVCAEPKPKPNSQDDPV